MPLVLRSEKGSQLTFNEMDGNFTYLEGLTPNTGSFATTGSNQFKSNQSITGSLNVSGSAIFTGGITGSSFTGSFVGDGSGLTGIPGVTPIATGSFATTGSNRFVGNQTITGSLNVSGSISQGLYTLASGKLSRAYGLASTASGEYSHAEGGIFGLGDSTIYKGGTASGTGSHAEGAETRASGIASHAEGFGSWAIGDYSHAEGNYTTASGDASHAEGFATFAGAGAHSEGENTRASGNSSHTEGYYTTASGNYSHAEGLGTIASGSYSHAQGAYNIAISSPSSFIIGNGISNGSRSNLVFASGSQFQVTGSLTISGSTIQSGSVDVSGSINADGFELDATSTSTVLALNSEFNLDLSGSQTPIIYKTLVLNDGKVLVAGRFESIDGHTTNDIARLNSNGSIDTSFTATSVGGGINATSQYINNFVTQSDNKIIIVGSFSSVQSNSRTGVARLNTNGTIDTELSNPGFTTFSEVRDVVIQSDNKIVVVGRFDGGIKRLQTDGTIDTSLSVPDSTGFTDNTFYSVALLPSGSEEAILVGGNFNQWNTSANYDYIVKLNPSGSLDTGFAGTNLNISAGGDLDRIKKIKVTDAYSEGDNGYIYIAGRFKDTLTGPNVRNAGFARLTTNDEGNGRGAFDSTFRTYITGSDPNNPGTQYVNDFDFYDGDKILLGGNFTTIGIPGYAITSANRFVIVDQNGGGQVSNWSSDGLASTYRLNTGSVNSVTLLPNDNVLVGGTFTSASNPSTAREGLASLKLTGFGTVTTSNEYSITANTNQLLVSSSNTYFSGNVNISGSITGSSLLVSGSARFTGGITGSSFTGSFVGDGSGLTGIPGVTPIATGSFATTGSNRFVGNQTITGSLILSSSAAIELTVIGNSALSGSLDVSGSINAPGSGSYRDFVNDPTKFRSIRGNGSGLFNIIEQSDSNISFAVSKITTNDLTGAITSNLSGANNNSYNDLQPTTSGVGRGARLMLTIAGGVVTSVRIFNISNSNNSYEEDGQPANRQGIGYVAGDTLTLAAGTGGIGGTGNLVITLRPQDIETYLGVDSNFKFNYHESPELQISTNTFGTNIGIGGGIADGIGSIAAGTGTVAAGSTGAAIAVGFQNLASSTATSVFGAYNTGSDAQTVVGIAAITLPGLESAFIIGNGNNASDRSNLLVAAGNEVQVTGSLLVTGSANVNGFVLLPQVSASLNFANDTAAASGGVPLGGLYRSGSFIQIRLV